MMNESLQTEVINMLNLYQCLFQEKALSEETNILIYRQFLLRLFTNMHDQQF